MSYLTGYDDANGLVLEDVRGECRRQDELKKAGRFPFTAKDDGLNDLERLAVLAEEFGEVARAVLENNGLANDKHGKNLRKELVQVAAVCVSWVEGMDRREAAIARSKDPLSVECPKCRQRPGHRCFKANRGSPIYLDPHPARLAALKKAAL